MKLTAEEKLMYEVMKAIYESGIPLDFKGSMVLKACLHKAGYEDDVRHSYEKFRFEGEVNKPAFDDVYDSVKEYIKDILPKQRNRDFER